MEIREKLGGMVRVSDMHLDPSSHHYIVLSHLYDWLKNVALNEAKGVLLDYGCGGQPYRQLFSSRVTRYIGADVAQSRNTKVDIDLVPGHSVALPDQSVDTVLSTQVLEHVPDFNFYLSDCWRLLKPHGVLILTVPMQWRHHEVPYDFWRFTRHGITHALSHHGFTIKDLTPCGGVYALIGQIWLSHLNERGYNRARVYKWVSRLALWLDRKNPDLDDTLNWMCIAQKHGEDTSGIRGIDVNRKDQGS